MNDYYVYEWIRLDTNEPFYVGKGKGDRCYKLNRGNNKHFNNIVKSIPVAVNILHDNLDEETSYGLECYYIWLYRDIIGYDLCNIADGGEGNSMIGEKNGMYGVHRYGEDSPMWGKHHTEESKRKSSKSHIGLQAGEKNGMYGVRRYRESNPMYGKRHSEETRLKQSKSRTGKYVGKDNPVSKSVICLTTKKYFLHRKKVWNTIKIIMSTLVAYQSVVREN